MENKDSKTKKEFEEATALCRDIFEKKLYDYGTSWRVMRTSSLTDQIFIKAKRIRSIEEKGIENIKIKEGVLSEYIGIVNYSAIALILLSHSEKDLSSPTEALTLYNDCIKTSTELMFRKNHDYDEAWRDMRVSSFTDIILQKLLRTREIEDHQGKTLISEGLDANYMDIINYGLFAIIKLTEEEKE